MTIYLDQVFLLNCLADLAALAATARLSGVPARRWRLAAGALCGGVYGTVCALPVGFLASPVCQLLAAGGLVRLAMGRRRTFLRLLALFYILSCTLSGALLGLLELLRGFPSLAVLNWKVFLLAGGFCYILLTLLFRGGASRAVNGQLLRIRLTRRGKSVCLTALLDTGHTLTDPYTGGPVLIADPAALAPLWSGEEGRVLAQFGRLAGTELLPELPGFFLLPYRAVGVEGGMLLCFRADGASVEGQNRGEITVALSPTDLGGGCCALWSGSGEEEYHHAA